MLLKLGETARCAGSAQGCTFTFAPPTAEVTSLTSAFDAATNTQVLTLEGSGFPSGNRGGIELYIDGFAQEPLSVSPTTATFTVTNALGRSTDDVVVYFADGLPSGHDQLGRLNLEPRIFAVSPATGSAGGTLLTITGSGFGVNDNGEDLSLQARTPSGWQDICAEVEVVSYGVVTCLTRQMEGQTDKFRLKTGSGAPKNCANALDDSACTFEQQLATSPQVTGASMSGSTISFVGTGFPTSGYTASGTFKAAQGQGVVHGSTSADVTFPGGIPIAAAAAIPKLVFTSTTDGSQLVAYSNATAVELANPLSVRDSTASLACSFAGGC